MFGVRRSLINHFLRVGGVGEDHFCSFPIITFILHALALASHSSLSHSDMITPSLALDAAEIGYVT